MITRRLAKLASAIVFAFALALSFAPAANAEGLAPSPGVQIPITAIVPIQACNNSVLVGVIGGGSGCIQH